MNTIVYMSFGQGSHIDEVAFSIFSGLHLLERHPSSTAWEFQFVVYTDRPADFVGLPVIVQHVPEKLRSEWFGRDGFILRGKCCALIAALETYGGKCVLVDTDTYFLTPPYEIFMKISPGHSVMYEFQGPICSWCSKIGELLEKKTSRAFGSELNEVTPLSPDFNSGVVGLDEADGRLLGDLLSMCDLFYAETKAWMSEEFAFSACLKRGTQINEVFRLVHHYYHPATKKAFRSVLPGYLARSRTAPAEERAEWLYRYRPVEPWTWRLFVALNRVKSMARRVGLFQEPVRQWRGRQPSGAVHRES